MPFPIRIADVMSSPVRTVGPETTAAEAAVRCSDTDVGLLVVVEDGSPTGIVTITDLVALLGRVTDPRTRPLREFMSSPVITIPSNVPVGEAAEMMLAHGISRLVVVDDGELVGIVSSDDIIRYVPQIVHRQQFESPATEGYGYRVRQETAYERSDWAFDCVCLSDDTVSVGDRVTLTKPISETDVRRFAEASGDTNRLHLNGFIGA